jgi:hypothetical protein
LTKRLETVEMSNQLQASMKKDMDERQREFFLRQQLQAIRKELGEGDDDKVELKELKEKVAEKGLAPGPVRGGQGVDPAGAHLRRPRRNIRCRATISTGSSICPGSIRPRTPWI